ASAESSVVAEPTDFTDEASGRSGKFSVERGDYRELMSLALPHLRNAEAAALNANQAEMLRRYAASFAGGSIDEHKAGSRAWIRDKGPAVETYMGFIESYRDPFGVRGEFESFVAVVNKEQSAKFNALVSNAEKFLSLLPWPAAYEKDKFLQPDFTALEIVTFANSGVPLGINIPNYDDIRQSEGFKNVSLGNVLSSSFSDPKTTFLVAEDKDIWIRRIAQSFEVQVGLHELLGHGSGKLFKQDSDGKFNFDPSSVVDLVTGKPVASWYKVGETWDGKFSNLASAFEECRAECVGVYLCDVPEVLAVFGHPDKAEADEVIYVNWLCMARAGVASLEMYSPENGGTWRQAHSRARFAILRALLEAGQGLVTIDEITGEDGKPDLTVRLDRSKISSVAKPAIGEFLKRLQSFKSTCSVEAGRAFFESYSTVDAYFQRLRDIVIARRKPRRVFIQANLSMDSAGSVSIVEYSDGPAEMIRSFRDRFSDEDWGRIEEALWQHRISIWNLAKHSSSSSLATHQQPVQQVALFSASLQATQQPVMDRSLYTVPTDAPKLSQAEKAYAYHLYRASWIGGLICLHQTSAESPGLFLVLQSVFRRQTPEQLRAACKAGVSDADWDAFLMYATRIITASEAHASSERVRVAWQRVRAAASSLTERNRQLGLGTAGITAYFSDNCDESDAKLAQAFLDSRQISAYNTRLFKSAGGCSYRIVQAAAESSVVAEPTDFTDEASGRSGKFSVERGDYRELMSLALPHLRNAEAAALNANQAEMLRRYAASFAGGSIDEHKAGSRAWIRDKGPAVETYMGFIESYRDPFGVRGEFESFVAVVNKEQSAKFNALVSNAEKFLPLLPWPAAYEKDKFLQPDFTALEIVTFASSEPPLGINIPNYDDIRQSEGFKNVSLGNVLSSSFSDPKTTFLAAEDRDVWMRRIVQANELQVGLHELLGHGSGKLFKQDSDGKFNFDPSSVVDLVTGKPVASWYKVGETWDGKFSNLASAFEECRAECVGVYLCDVPEVLAVFGHPDKAEADEVIYVNWLCMARAGVAFMYSPENGGTWRQAHSQAAFVMLRVMLEAGQGLVTIDEITGEDGKPDLTVRLDRSKISSVAKPAIGEFLKRLQSFKSTCSVEAGRAFFESYSTVDAYFQRLRDIVIARRKPRRVFIQANLSMDSAGSVSIVEYSDGPAEMIRSFRDRFSDEDWGRIEEALWQQWERDLPLMKLDLAVKIIEFSSMSVAVDATSNVSLESGFSPLHLFECTLANAGMLVDSMPPTDLVLALRFLSTLHGRIVDVMEPSVGDACRLANAYKTCFDPNEPAKEPAATSQQVSDSTVDKKSNYLSTTVAVKTESKSSLKAATMPSDCQFAQQDSNMDYASEYSDDCLIVDELNEATTSNAAAEDSSASEARTRAEAALKDSYQSIKGSSLHPFDFSKPFEHETNQSVAERVLRVTASRTAGTLGLSKDDLMSILRSSIFNVFGPYRLKNKKSYTRTRWKQQVSKERMSGGP
uniref:Dipeptidyl peptidase 3 n=1 Tax=Macrostomum lignano TaxID=282301 RepID=A0A1I8HAG1_9PLAT